MGTSSTKKLTKYTSGTTIVTADVANAWFGGLSGSYEGTLLDADDPRVIGHVHDGDSYDGHAGKINLVNHVTDKLQHQNLADEAVWKNNVASFLDQTQAIPESVTVGSDKYYFLDLRDIYTYVDDEIAAVVSGTSPFEEADSNGDTVDDVVRQSNHDYTSTGLDFVFASQKLDDMADATKGDNRFLFDRSKGAFRAGSVDSTQWDDGNRGDYSFASGRNATASGDGSAAVGVENTASGDNTFVAGGTNTVSGNNSAVFGSTNTVAGVASLVSGDQNLNIVGSNYSAVFGQSNESQSPGTLIAGFNNTAFSGAITSVILGDNNSTIAPHSLVFGKEALGKIDGEIVHASGKFTTVGDAQTSSYTARGKLIAPTAAPGLALSVDGLGGNYQMDVHAAYNISVMLIGKIAGPSQEAGAYKLEALGIGPTTTPAAATMSAPLITYISRSAYFLAGPGYVNVTMAVDPATANIQVKVSDTHPVGAFLQTNWVATVTITKCKY